MRFQKQEYIDLLEHSSEFSGDATKKLNRLKS